MATGFTAWKMAKGLYIVPLLFAYTPILHGTLVGKARGHAVHRRRALRARRRDRGAYGGRINWVTRAIMAALCVVLIWPEQAALHWAALAVFAAMLAWNILQDRASARPAPA
jgi:TRAP-type uncharacterized transport system fused permease subunit